MPVRGGLVRKAGLKLFDANAQECADDGEVPMAANAQALRSWRDRTTLPESLVIHRRDKRDAVR